MLCCDPSPQASGHPRCPPQHRLPLLPLEGCLSTWCLLQAENAGTQDSNVTLVPGAWAWSGMAGIILLLPCQPRSQHPLLGLRGCVRGQWGKAGKSVGI